MIKLRRARRPNLKDAQDEKDFGSLPQEDC